ncbi:antitermination protein Q [Salmonella enterica]|nr:antitermination protein Q [Salmonella enterica]
MRDIQKVLERWGAWAASDSCNVDYSPIAAGFKGLLPKTSKTRISCTDDDGLIIEGCMARLKQKQPYDYRLLVVHYVHGVSKREIARNRKKSEKQIRIEMLVAEGFIEGCLSMLNVSLEMDPLVFISDSQKSSSAVCIF